MEAANLPLGSIPVVFAEDETKITPKAEFDHATKSICGVKCAAKCTSASTCKKKQCVDPHGCRDGYHIALPTGDDAYARITEAHGSSTTGTLARAVVLCPLNPALRRIPILWTPT